MIHVVLLRFDFGLFREDIPIAASSLRMTHFQSTLPKTISSIHHSYHAIRNFHTIGVLCFILALAVVDTFITWRFLVI